MEIVQKRFVTDVFESASSKYLVCGTGILAGPTQCDLSAETHANFVMNPCCRGISWMESPHCG
jgi:hypothetical protein